MLYNFEDITSEILLDREIIKNRIRELGEEISKDYAGKDLVLVGVLRGAVVFLADLIRTISIPLEVDFIDVSSYGNETQSSGIVRILKDISVDVEKKDVLLIEDIVDTGLTWDYLKENIASKNPQSIKICCLLDKPSRRMVDIASDYTGFTIADKFVIGFGLDCQDYFRNIPWVGIPSEKAWELSTEKEFMG